MAVTSREAEDRTGYELQQELATEILTIVSDKPTLEYTNIKRFYLTSEYNPNLEQLKVDDVFKREGFNTNPQQIDLLIWKNYRSPYLPYLFGSIDGRTFGLNNTVMKYDQKTYDKGLHRILLQLEKIYKVIKFRNPIHMMPKATKKIDWRDRCRGNNDGTVNYYYRWDKEIRTLLGKPSIAASFSPSFKKINLLQKTQMPFYYTLEHEYNFVFFPVAKSLQEITDCSKAIDVSPMLHGLALRNNEIWPRGLKRISFPMHAVEMMVSQYPLFNYLAKHHHQKNRNLNYYTLKEDVYYQFLASRGGVEIADGTAVVGSLLVGNDINEAEHLVDLLVPELKARIEATEYWEDYED